MTAYLRKYASDNIGTVEIVGKCPKYIICFVSIDVIHSRSRNLWFVIKVSHINNIFIYFV